MAKRKKAVKRHTSRRRIGGIGQDLQHVGFAVIGAVAGRTLANVLSKAGSDGSPLLDKKIGALIVTASGFALSKFVKNPIGQYAGLGMAAIGGVTLAQSAGVLNGIDGYLNSSNAVAGFLPAAPQVAGVSSMVSGFKAADPGIGCVGMMVDEC